MEILFANFIYLLLFDKYLLIKLSIMSSNIIQYYLIAEINYWYFDYNLGYNFYYLFIILLIDL